MKFTRILPYIFALTCVSCLKEKSEVAENTKKEVNDTVLRIAPLDVKLNKVSLKYKSAKTNSIDNFYHKLWRKDDLSGGFLVAKNGKILYEKYGGFANRSNKVEITSQTPVHLASVSKVFTAALVLKLIDRNKLQLDQKVNTLLPEFPYEDITVRMLLNHRSGLPNYAYFCDDKAIWDRSMLTNQDILNLFAQHKFNLYFLPDKKFGYCNTNYAMLALIIEKVTHMNYREAMKKIVFEPLGMKNTYVFDYQKDRETASRSYKGNNVLYGYDFLDDVYGDKNIYSTPRDMLKFDLATYSKKFLNPELYKEVFQGYSYEHKGTKNYGLGIRLHEWETGEKLFYHNGWWHGNTTSYVTLKKDTVTIIALSNKFSYKPYKVWKLAPLFGHYPIKPDKDDELE
ncbi:serine hydrolase domain-containing protein [Flavobacterium sp. DG1-102-2]|uniref:serine hydrolase domain-containing protein n=1 Tax=Flavobacterium sp. DG1-102-2 TaxID=3081663 RepID=UPI0029495C25|nr:serine hydrolase domain-containing protein [Flavobacterium sp. DG1-102-2]MDV6167087.1 serine hydrolase domain-containing protein [Flavobacterium sp. DG1-102-2]